MWSLDISLNPAAPLAGHGGICSSTGVDPERDGAGQHPVWAAIRRGALRGGAGCLRPAPRPRHPARRRQNGDRRES